MTNVIEVMPALGVGITYSATLEPLFEQEPHLFDVIEVEPQTVWRETTDQAERYQITDELRRSCEFAGPKACS